MNARVFYSQDELLQALAPVGLNQARALLNADPRAPKPQKLTQRGGRLFYPAAQVEQWLEQVRHDGFAPDVVAAAALNDPA